MGLVLVGAAGEMIALADNLQRHVYGDHVLLDWIALIVPFLIGTVLAYFGGRNPESRK